MEDSEGFPAADAKNEMNPGKNKDFQVDPVSSEVETSKRIKEQHEEARKIYEREKKDTLQVLKNGVIISGIVLAVAIAAFTMARKMREK